MAGKLGGLRFDLGRLGVFLFGDRLMVAALQRGRVEAFAVEAENPAAALRAELDQRGLSPRTVAIGLPRSAVTVKPIELPTVEGDLQDMVRFELERHLPSGSDDASFDYLPLPVDTEAPPGPAPTGRQVLIAAADRRVVDTALRIVEEARLRPVSITVASHNLTALVPRRRQGRIVWVHRAGDAADLLFLFGSALVLSRHLAQTDGSRMTEEIRRSFAITRWRDCEAIWVSGDVTPDDAGALGELGAPVGEPPYTARAREDLSAITETPRGALDLALAVASAGRVRPLELIAPALRPRHLTQSQLVTVGIAAATLLLALGALLVPGVRERRHLSDVNTRIARLDPQVRSVEKVVQELERKRRLLATIQSVESTSIRPLPVIRELTELLPNDAWLTMLSLDTKGIELTGQAAAAAALIPILEDSPRFERAEFSSPVTRGRDREQFRIRAAWEVAPSAPLAGPTPISPSRSRPRSAGEPTPGLPALQSPPPPPDAPPQPRRTIQPGPVPRVDTR